VKTAPVVPARLERDADGLPRSPEFGDVYHPRQGALAQARQVFLAGNGLPARWRGRARFVVLETGFGLGNNFLATWHAWRDDPQRPERLHFVSIEARPLQRPDLAAEPRDEPLAPLAAELAAAWPPLTCNLHRLSFDAGRVELLLAFGDVADWLPQLVAGVDAFFLDGFAPARNPGMWEPRLFKAMARLAARDATAATWSVARPVREGLAAAGFAVASVPGSGGKREITVARFAPRFVPRPDPRGAADARVVPDGAGAAPAVTTDSPVAIVGGGLAGCALAAALATQGRAAVVYERRAALAQEGSGNAAGVFHGVVHADDGRHARFHRAAAIEARHAVAAAIAAGQVRGSASGLLRLARSGTETASLVAQLDRLGLPADYVRAVSAADASTLAGIALPAPAWHFPGGGWVEPRGLAHAYVEAAGHRPRGALRLRRRRDPTRRGPLAAPRRGRRRARERRDRRSRQRRRRARPARQRGARAAFEPRPGERHRDRTLAAGRRAAPAPRRLGLPPAVARRHDLVRGDLGRRGSRSRGSLRRPSRQRGAPRRPRRASALVRRARRALGAGRLARVERRPPAARRRGAARGRRGGARRRGRRHAPRRDPSSRASRRGRRGFTSWPGWDRAASPARRSARGCWRLRSRGHRCPWRPTCSMRSTRRGSRAAHSGAPAWRRAPGPEAQPPLGPIVGGSDGVWSFAGVVAPSPASPPEAFLTAFSLSFSSFFFFFASSRCRFSNE
jgi:tRNA U34 5-methylaminomethyl-2-thiouridine-forming methyltransferase MnmC